MNLTVITPSPNFREKRLFECPKCGFIETRIVSDIISGKEFA
jgi:hypothetical protein